MGYRDESEALRARITTLESQLEDARNATLNDDVGPSVLGSRSAFKKRVVRYSKTIEGRVSKKGVEAIWMELWTKLGDADPTEGTKLGAADLAPGSGEGAPGKRLLTHTRGHQVVRVTESGGKTHLSVDHYKWTFGQSFITLALVAVVLTLGMIGAGVHTDWIQMVMGGYGGAVVLLGTFAILNGWSRESASADILKSIGGIATEDIAAQPEPVRARVQAAGAVQEGRDESVEELPEESLLGLNA